MKRKKLHLGMATVGLLACAALTGLVGHSIGGDEPDVTDLTRPKKPKPRVYDSRIQMHRMDWTFEGDEAIYRRKKRNEPKLPPGAKDTPAPVNTELRQDTPYVRPPSTTEDSIDETKRNWILPPTPEGAEEATESSSPWDSLKLSPTENPDVTNPYESTPPEESLTSEEREIQQLQELSDSFLMSEEDIAAMAREAATQERRTLENETGFQPVLSDNSFGSDFSGLGFGMSMLSRDGEDEGDEYAENSDQGATEALGSADRLGGSLSDRLGIGRPGEALQLTRRNLGFTESDPQLEGSSPRAETEGTSAPGGWRNVLKGVGGNLQTLEPVGTTDTATYSREAGPKTSAFMPGTTSETYRDASFTAESFAPAGPAGTAEFEREAGGYRGTEFGPTSVDRFSFSSPTFDSGDFAGVGEGQQRLREKTSGSQVGGNDPFSRFADPASSSDSTSGDRNDQFRILMR